MTKNFKLVQTKTVDLLNVRIDEYIHTETQARHIHFHPLKPHNQENVFMVGFNTIPQDNTGIAHILEHTVLCGSQKFQIPDPFFSMTRRSINTFMNAMTAEDWTAYPFASQNKTDFNNLMEVYLDATLFSTIDKASFQQEGWHYDFDEEGHLMYKGVVFNEMKGAMANPHREINAELNKKVLEGSTYQFNSGGDPKNIPELTYEKLKDFYSVFYHPSNAIFMTYGDIPAVEHQEKIQAWALQHFKYKDIQAELSRLSDNGVVFDRTSKPQTEPQKVDFSFFQPHVNPEGSNHVITQWNLGKPESTDETLKAQVVMQYLCGDSASPLSQALESSKLGVNSPFTGLQEDGLEMLVGIALDQVKDQDVAQVQTLIKDTLIRLTQEPTDVNRIKEILTKIELNYRDVQGGMPYGLTLMLHSLPKALNGYDLAKVLDLDSSVANIQEEINQPDFIAKFIKGAMIENTQRFECVAKADETLEAKRQQDEVDRLAVIESSMSEEAKAIIRQENEHLERHQLQVVDLSVLPDLELSDLEFTEHHPSCSVKQYPTQTHTVFDAQTNGVSHWMASLEIPELTSREHKILPIYLTMLNRIMGTDQRSFQEQVQWHSKHHVSGFHVVPVIVKNYKTHQPIANIKMGFKTLNQHFTQAIEVVGDYIEHVNFRDTDRLAYWINSSYQQMSHSIQSAGSSIIGDAVSQSFNTLATIEAPFKYREELATLKEFHSYLESEDKMSALGQEFEALHQKLKAQWNTFHFISDQKTDAAQKQTLRTFPGYIHEGLRLTEQSLDKTEAVHHRQAFLADVAGNNVQISWKGPQRDDPDLPATLVLCELLSKPLHHKIREVGNAYGARCQVSNGMVSMLSYRDPRLLDTMADMDAVIQEFIQVGQVSEEDLKEAIMQTLQNYVETDAPVPAVKKEVMAQLTEYPVGQHLQRQHEIMNTTFDDVMRVAKRFLTQENVCAVFTNPKNKELLESKGFYTQNAAPEVKATPTPFKL